MEIAAGLHLIPGMSTANACLLVGDSCVLFDAGLPGDGPRVLAYLQRLGRTPRDLTLIALTHADPGHAGAAAWLRRNSAARIAASPETAALAQQGHPPGMVRRAWHGTLALLRRPVEAFAADMLLGETDAPGGFQVIPTPGHAPGHLSFFRPSDGVLIAGDAVRVSGHDLLAPAFWDSDSEWQARISIARLADLPVHLLVPGHGPPYREPGAQLRRVGGPPGFLEEVMRHKGERRPRRRSPPTPPG